MDEKKREKHDKLKAWFPVKEKLSANPDIIGINEGEIWWCSCGENVGTEINGKNGRFTRPVLIFKKFNKNQFFGIPLTSKKHTGSWYVHFYFAAKDNYAVLCQARTFSVSRLHKRMGQINSSEYLEIKMGFLKLIG